MSPAVGIVLVAHSARLADALAELAGELTGGGVPVEAAGGTEDGGTGTSIEKVERALRSADLGAGVVVLADLGSSVLTVKTLLEDDPLRAVLADAPFVEGALAAVMTAATGGDRAAVLAAAEEARGFRKL